MRYFFDAPAARVDFAAVDGFFADEAAGARRGAAFEAGFDAGFAAVFGDGFGAPERTSSTLAATFLALVVTKSTTSGALSLTNSVATDTCSCTRGSFQTFNAADLISLYRARPARVPKT
jgi:hypothetical protein